MQLTIVIDEAACLGLDPVDVGEALTRLLGSGLTLQSGFNIDAEAIAVHIDEDEPESMTALVARDRANLALKAASLGMAAPRTALERILVRNGGVIQSAPPRKGSKLKRDDRVFERAKVMDCTAYIEAVCAGDKARVDELQRTMKVAYRWRKGDAEIFTVGWRFAQLIDLALDDENERRRATRAHHAMLIVFGWDHIYDPEFGSNEIFEGLNLQRLVRHMSGGTEQGRGRWWLGEASWFDSENG